MSGGGLVAGRELIGNNGAHAHPLWPGQWNDASGKPVSAALNEKLELVSLGLSAATIETALRSALPPAPLPWRRSAPCAVQPALPPRLPGPARAAAADALGWARFCAVPGLTATHSQPAASTSATPTCRDSATTRLGSALLST